MKLAYVIRHVGMTGGVKVFFQHVEMLRTRGHDVRLFARFIENDWSFRIEPEVVSEFSDKTIPAADGIVVTIPKDVEDLWPLAKRRGVPLFHFMQGFEPDYVLERITGKVVPERYQSDSLITRLKYKRKIWGWRRKLKRFDALYQLPTIKMAISPHLVESIRKRLGKESYYLPNGIDLAVFRPKERPLDYTGQIRVLSVGNSTIEYKAIPDIWEALRLLKESGFNVTLTRVSQREMTDEERNRNIVDRYFVRATESEMANLYRESHVVISASTEIEGFGLPPVEAMGCATPTILTRVSPFLAFDSVHDYAYFVDVHRPDQIAAGIVELSRNEQLRNDIIRRGSAVSQNYSLERIGRQLEEILLRHIGKEEQ